MPQRESEFYAAAFMGTIDVAQNGTVLCYVANDGASSNTRTIYRRDLDNPLPYAVVETTEGALFPTLSPDAKWLVYAQPGPRKLLMKVPIQGGPLTPLCDTDFVSGLAWTEDGHIVYAGTDAPGRLMRVSENGGTPEEIPLPDARDKWPRWVHAMSDGKSVLYALHTARWGGDDSTIEAYSFATKQSKRLVQNGTYPLYARSGHLLFMREGKLMAAALDADSLQRTSEPVVAVPDVRSGFGGSTRVALTDDGTLYYCEGADTAGMPEQTIYEYKLDGDGTRERFSQRTGLFADSLSITRDGRFLALVRFDLEEESNGQGGRVWLLDVPRDVPRSLNDEPGQQQPPVISPDGMWVYYTRIDNDKWLGIFRQRRTESGGGERVYDAPRPCHVDSISPDGQKLFVTEEPSEKNSPGTATDIAVLQLGSEGEKATRTPWYQGSGNQFRPTVSPNGLWVAFVSNHDGQGRRVYVKSIAGEGAPYPVFSGPGSGPMWSPDGSTLYFRTDGGRVLMSASVVSGAQSNPEDAQPTFEIGEVTQKLELGRILGPGLIMPDGKLLQVDVVRDETNENGQTAVDDPAVIHVVRNFFTELERLAPTKKKNATTENSP